MICNGLAGEPAQRGEAEEAEEAHHVGHHGDEDGRGHRGVDVASLSSVTGTRTPERPAIRLLISIAARSRSPTAFGAVDDTEDQRHAGASARRARARWPDAIRNSREASAQRVRAGQLIGRERADHHGQRLRAGIAAHAGDDRHQHGEQRRDARSRPGTGRPPTAARIAVPRLTTSQVSRARGRSRRSAR